VNRQWISIWQKTGERETILLLIRSQCHGRKCTEKVPLDFNCQLKAEDDEEMDQVELKSEKDDNDERETGDGPALTEASDRIEVPAILQLATEPEIKKSLGMAEKKAGIKKTAAKQSKAKASLESVKKAAAPVKQAPTKIAPAKKGLPAKKTPAAVKKAATPVKKTAPARRKLTTVKNATKSTKKVVAPAKKAVKKVAAKKTIKKVAVKKAVKKGTKK